MKGDILKFKNYKIRGLNNNCYFYCKGIIDDESIFVRCIITQAGDVLISNEIIDMENFKNDCIKTSIDEFLNKKYDFEKNSIVALKNDEGSIRDIDNNNKKLTIEVETSHSGYKEIKVKFDAVLIVYPEFTYNNRQQFKQIKN